MQTKQVYLVRHGKSESNTDGIYRGQATLLTDEGRAQAGVVAERMRAIGADALIASPWPRTVATAEPIAAALGLPLATSELLTERRNASSLIGRSQHDPEVRAIVQQMFAGYATPGHRYADEENAEDLLARAQEALAFLAARPEERLCVVTHGIFLCTLLCVVVCGKEATGKDLQRFLHHFDTDNTGITHLEYRKNAWAEYEEGSWRWYVRSWNDRAHFG